MLVLAVGTEHSQDLDARRGLEPLWAVIVWNDDVNTFDHVIRAFVEILGHSPGRAEQLAHRIHDRGRAAVAVRPRDEAASLVEAFGRRAIGATMEAA